MNRHVRANLWLLGLTLLLCCVLYPLVLWGIGQTIFPSQAEGSLIYGPDGQAVIGSRLIGQPFRGGEYFQPRPSATSPGPYNAAASGASNWGANNPKLRDRAARQLGPIAEYAGDDGKLVGPDIEKWFAERTDPRKVNDNNPDLVASWAKDYSILAANWVNQDEVTKNYVKQWTQDHPEVMKKWRKDNPDASAEPKPEDLATYFFTSFAKVNPGQWPALQDVPGANGKTEKKVKLVNEGSDIQATFFDLWLQAHKDVQLKEVPADMVMASGSGLDPHITYANAKYQAPRVVKARARKLVQAREKTGDAPLPEAQRADITRTVREDVEGLIGRLASPPMGGLAIAGEERIVNVLELNLALDAMYP